MLEVLPELHDSTVTLRIRLPGAEEEASEAVSLAQECPREITPDFVAYHHLFRG